MNLQLLDVVLISLVTAGILFAIFSILLWRKKKLAQKELEMAPVASIEDPLESEILNLEQSAHDLYNQGKFADSERVALVAYRRTCTVHGADYWRAAVNLNRIACAAMSQGKHSQALDQLNAASAILSEWPSYADSDLGAIIYNQKVCQDYLGI